MSDYKKLLENYYKPGLTAGQAKRLDIVPKKQASSAEKNKRQEARNRFRAEKEAFVAKNKLIIRDFLKRGIDPKKKVHIVTTNNRVLFLTRLNPETGIATCRTTWHTIGVKFAEIARLARDDECPRIVYKNK